MAHLSLKVNGKAHLVDVDPECPLLYVLRDNAGLNNPRFGCGLGQCGACTVLVNQVPTRSCMLPVARASGKEIVTLEGLGTPEKPHAIQRAFIDEQAAQCGFCMNGIIMTAKVLLDKTPNPTDTDIKQALNGILCRCGSHVRVLLAIKRAASVKA